MGFIAMYIIYFKGNLDTVKKRENAIIITAFLIPFPFSLAPFFIKPGGVKLYGDVTFWCWVKNSEYQMYLWFINLWVIFILNLLVLFLTIKGIRKIDQELRFNQEKYVLITNLD
jgi:hypothetical protein